MCRPPSLRLDAFSGRLTARSPASSFQVRSGCRGRLFSSNSCALLLIGTHFKSMRRPPGLKWETLAALLATITLAAATVSPGQHVLQVQSTSAGCGLKGAPTWADARALSVSTAWVRDEAPSSSSRRASECSRTQHSRRGAVVELGVLPWYRRPPVGRKPASAWLDVAPFHV